MQAYEWVMREREGVRSIDRLDLRTLLLSPTIHLRTITHDLNSSDWKHIIEESTRKQQMNERIHQLGYMVIN